MYVYIYIHEYVVYTHTYVRVSINFKDINIYTYQEFFSGRLSEDHCHDKGGTLMWICGCSSTVIYKNVGALI